MVMSGEDGGRKVIVVPVKCSTVKRIGEIVYAIIIWESVIVIVVYYLWSVTWMWMVFAKAGTSYVHSGELLLAFVTATICGSWVFLFGWFVST